MSNLPRQARGGPVKNNPILRQMLLDLLTDSLPELRVVQVGANDGRMADPIYQNWSNPKWRGLLVEPHPIYFADLSKRHAGNTNIALVNCAVSTQATQLELFHLDEAFKGRFPFWLRGCASLERSRMEDAVNTAVAAGKMKPDQDVIKATKVEARPLSDILSDAGWSQIDLLVVDVEGHELAVLDSAGLETRNLRAALIECNGANAHEEQDIVRRLVAIGMIAFRMGDDILGFRPNTIQLPFEVLLHFLNRSPLNGSYAPEMSE